MVNCENIVTFLEFSQHKSKSITILRSILWVKVLEMAYQIWGTMTALIGTYIYWSCIIKAVCVSAVHSIIMTHLILTFVYVDTSLCHQHYTKLVTIGILTSFSQLLHEYPSFWILLMKCVHHNDIMSAKVNTAAPCSHRDPFEYNLEPVYALPTY